MSNKFEKGDTVIRLRTSHIDVKKGGVYIVSGVFNNNSAIRLRGITGTYLADLFKLTHDGEASSISTRDN